MAGLGIGSPAILLVILSVLGGGLAIGDASGAETSQALGLGAGVGLLAAGAVFGGLGLAVLQGRRALSMVALCLSIVLAAGMTILGMFGHWPGLWGAMNSPLSAMLVVAVSLSFPQHRRYVLLRSAK